MRNAIVNVVSQRECYPPPIQADIDIRPAVHHYDPFGLSD